MSSDMNYKLLSLFSRTNSNYKDTSGSLYCVKYTNLLGQHLTTAVNPSVPLFTTILSLKGLLTYLHSKLSGLFLEYKGWECNLVGQFMPSKVQSTSKHKLLKHEGHLLVYWGWSGEEIHKV